MVSALDSRIRDREFESCHNIFLIIKLFFVISLYFLFIFLNFEVNNVRIFFESTTILDLQWKRSQTFLFFKMANTAHKGKTRHIAWISSFLFKVQCFYRDENDLAPYDKYYIRGKRNALWFWQHFGRTITLADFDIPIVSTESQVLYSFIIKVRMDTLIFYFLIFF